MEFLSSFGRFLTRSRFFFTRSVAELVKKKHFGFEKFVQRVKLMRSNEHTRYLTTSLHNAAR